MIRLDIPERRRRLAVRHRLSPAHQIAGPPEITRALVALHSTDPATVYLSARARTADPEVTAALDGALYERRDLIRMLGMRRTVFVFPAGAVAVVRRSTTDKIAADQRKRLLGLLADASGVVDPVTWLARAEEAALGAMTAAGGSATAAELTAAVPQLRTQLVMAAGKPYEARTNVTSRLVFLLAAEGKLVRGRPLGGWLSQQYRWWLTDLWLSRQPVPVSPESASAVPAPDEPALTESGARAELARRWLAAFGPAPLADLKWWTGWTLGQARQAAADAGAVEVEIGAANLALPDDLEITPDPGPWAALLPALDPTVMGWAEREWFLGQHVPALFDKTGNAGPTIWLNGRVVGGWAQRPDGEIAIRLLEDTGADGAAMIEAEAARLGDWLGDQRVTPRFRTPLERELSA